MTKVVTKEEIKQALKTDSLNGWGNPLYCGIPLYEFTKEEIIQIVNKIYTKDFTLKYPDKSDENS
jgi:hypothetical protein